LEIISVWFELLDSLAVSKVIYTNFKKAHSFKSYVYVAYSISNIAACCKELGFTHSFFCWQVIPWSWKS